MTDNRGMRFLSSDSSLAAPATTQIRPLQLADLQGLMQVQEACYGSEYMEAVEVYADRMASGAQCSWVAVQGDQVLAYLAAYRSRLGCVTPLHGAFVNYVAPDTLYLHDMAVHPDCTGQGLANALLAALWRGAAVWSPAYSALVSVQGSQAYWQRKGYAPYSALAPADAAALRSYGDDAVYMVQHYRAERM
ncbi:MAG: GNAT family N-acetyltransferase [Comamonas sp.]